MGTRHTCVMLAAALCVAVVLAGTPAAAGDTWRLTLEGGDVVTFGTLDVSDASIDIDPSYANPRLGVEFAFKKTPLSVGLEFAQSSNTFDGEYEESDGTIDARRTEFALFGRLGPEEGVNLRLGYRSFSYDFEDGTIHQRDADSGTLEEVDSNCEAKGDLAAGLDVELNLLFGGNVRGGLALGYTYFFDADYRWAYDKTAYDAGGTPGPTTHETGAATLDAQSFRLKPQIEFRLVDNLWMYLDYTLMATWWTGTTPDDEYPGYDLYSGFGVGVRWLFNF